MDRASSLDVVDDSITNEVRGSETGATTSLPVVPLPSQNSPVDGRPRLSSLNGSENGAGSGGVSSAPSLDPARRSSGASGTTAHASSTPRSPLADQGRGKSSGNTSTGADAKSANTGSGGLGSGGAAKPQAASVSGAPPVGESPTAARPGTPESGAASELDRSRGSRTASPGRRAILVSSNSPGTQAPALFGSGATAGGVYGSGTGVSLPRTYDSKRHPKSAGVDDVAREGKDNSWWDRMFRRDGTQSDQALDDERAEGLQGGMVRDSLQRRFNLPPSEILIEDYACALHHGILLQGRMYVYPRHVCFACDLIAKTRTICIPFTDVTDIRKATTALIFHNAIEIHTTEHKYLFASFLFRREAYKGLTNFWTISRAIVSALRDAKSLEEEEEEDEALKAAVEAAQTDGSACPEAPGALEALHARGDSPAGAVGAGGGGSSGEALEPRAPPGGEDAAGGAGWSSPSRVRMHLDVNSLERDRALADDPVLVAQQAPPTPATEALRLGALQVQDTTGQDLSLVPDESLYSIQIVEPPATLPTDALGFYRAFFSQGSKASSFRDNIRQQLGETDVKESQWNKLGAASFARELQFTSKINSPLPSFMSRKYTRVREMQLCRFSPDRTHFAVETSSTFLDIPYGDSFVVNGRWDVTPAEGGVELRLRGEVKFHKRCLFKSKIQVETAKELRATFAHWLATACEVLEGRLQLPETPAPYLRRQTSLAGAPFEAYLTTSTAASAGLSGNVVSPASTAEAPEFVSPHRGAGRHHLMHEASWVTTASTFDRAPSGRSASVPGGWAAGLPQGVVTALLAVAIGTVLVLASGPLLGKAWFARKPLEGLDARVQAHVREALAQTQRGGAAARGAGRGEAGLAGALLDLKMEMWERVVEESAALGVERGGSCPHSEVLAMRAAHQEAHAELSQREVDALEARLLALKRQRDWHRAQVAVLRQQLAQIDAAARPA